MDQPQCVTDFLTDLESRVTGHRLARVGRYVHRLFEQTLNRLEDGTVFVVTGDIPAMWIRDSTWQMLPLLDFQPDAQLQEIIGSVSRRQTHYLAIDPYANAFNESASGGCWHKDFEDQSDWVFERKFELDSWSTFFELALSLYERTGYQTHLDDHFWEVSQSILNLCLVEQNHIAKSYRFQREKAPEPDYLSHDGYGAPLSHTGLVWSAFRPSDDRCVYGYHIPANAHLAATLKRLGKVAREHDRAAVAELADSLSLTVSDAIRHQVVAHGRYPYEVDGLGNALFMDDPNIPSLLSLPELGWCSKIQPEFLATRDWILSKEHSYYFEANGFAGLMSDHTPAGNIWPLSIAMRGLTSSTREEQITCIEMLEAGDGGTGDMHESFDCANPSSFTRPWFSWADMTYVQLVLRANP